MQAAPLYAGLFIAWRFFRRKIGEVPLFARELFGLFVKMFFYVFRNFLISICYKWRYVPYPDSNGAAHPAMMPFI
jgi:hypothetical protein